jgi:hypothetical protein
VFGVKFIREDFSMELVKKMPTRLSCDLASYILLLVATAGENGKPRIFGKFRIAGREFAEKKHRSTFGFNRTGVDTIGTKACVRNSVGRGRVLGHGKSIAAVRWQIC